MFLLSLSQRCHHQNERCVPKESSDGRPRQLGPQTHRSHPEHRKTAAGGSEVRGVEDRETREGKGVSGQAPWEPPRPRPAFSVVMGVLGCVPGEENHPTDMPWGVGFPRVTSREAMGLSQEEVENHFIYDYMAALEFGPVVPAFCRVR